MESFCITKKSGRSKALAASHDGYEIRGNVVIVADEHPSDPEPVAML